MFDGFRQHHNQGQLPIGSQRIRLEDAHLIDGVDHAFACTALTAVAEAEVLGLPEDLRRPVVQVQRDHVGLWTEQLRRHRPELEVREARVLVHAALGVVVEVGRHLHWQDSPGHRRVTRELMLRALDA